MNVSLAGIAVAVSIKRNRGQIRFRYLRNPILAFFGSPEQKRVGVGRMLFLGPVQAYFHWFKLS